MMLLIDWESSIKAIGKKEFAEQMVQQLLQRLPDDVNLIKHHYDIKNYSEMWSQVHKLHGTLCYCVLPRLKAVIEQLETALKNNIMVGLPSLLGQLDNEVDLLLRHQKYSQYA